LKTPKRQRVRCSSPLADWPVSSRLESGDVIPAAYHRRDIALDRIRDAPVALLIALWR
jgi:hypothetical protein